MRSQRRSNPKNPVFPKLMEMIGVVPRPSKLLTRANAYRDETMLRVRLERHRAKKLGEVQA